MAESSKYPFSTLAAVPDELRAALERSLVPVARSAAVGELAADIGHDLANPLFAVIGIVDLLLLDPTLEPPVAERLQLVKDTALGLKESLGVLMAFTRAPAGHESASLDDAVGLAASLVRRGHAKQLALALTMPTEPVIVRCPAGPLAQAALHLLAAGRAAAGDTGSLDAVVGADGTLQVTPAAADGIGIVAARRIAADQGGTLVHTGETLTLRLPLWVAS